FHHALRPSDNSGESMDAWPFEKRFVAAMDDDLNTPQAIAALFDLAREINRAGEAGQSINEAQDTLRNLGSILGLTFQGQSTNGQGLLSALPFIDLLLSTRAELRKAKQYALADKIREGLAEQGIVLEDTSQGTLWQYQPGPR
ncbi:MAG TPA: DALR domain-containing protein, partial [Dehalococcoidia bacterium]|nr:DALR domain-containing protein [Dehalococcoidia bacterium]